MCSIYRKCPEELKCGCSGRGRDPCRQESRTELVRIKWFRDIRCPSSLRRRTEGIRIVRDRDRWSCELCDCCLRFILFFFFFGAPQVITEATGTEVTPNLRRGNDAASTWPQHSSLIKRMSAAVWKLLSCLTPLFSLSLFYSVARRRVTSRRGNEWHARCFLFFL